jgi:hypothetical protein
MSTLTRSGVGTSFARHSTSVQRSEQLPHHAALIPRSALTEAGGLSRETDEANPTLETHGYHSLNIDISLDTHPTVSVEVAQDGKSTKPSSKLSCLLVARVLTYIKDLIPKTTAPLAHLHLVALFPVSIRFADLRALVNPFPPTGFQPTTAPILPPPSVQRNVDISEVL